MYGAKNIYEIQISVVNECLILWKGRRGNLLAIALEINPCRSFF